MSRHILWIWTHFEPEVPVLDSYFQIDWVQTRNTVSQTVWENRLRVDSLCSTTTPVSHSTSRPSRSRSGSVTGIKVRVSRGSGHFRLARYQPADDSDMPVAAILKDPCRSFGSAPAWGLSNPQAQASSATLTPLAVRWAGPAYRDSA